MSACVGLVFEEYFCPPHSLARQLLRKLDQCSSREDFVWSSDLVNVSLYHCRVDFVCILPRQSSFVLTLPFRYRRALCVLTKSRQRALHESGCKSSNVLSSKLTKVHRVNLTGVITNGGVCLIGSPTYAGRCSWKSGGVFKNNRYTCWKML